MAAKKSTRKRSTRKAKAEEPDDDDDDLDIFDDDDDDDGDGDDDDDDAGDDDEDDDSDDVLRNEEIEVLEAMPWAHESCPACHGVGLNTSGGVCKVCTSKAKKKGDDFPQADDYTIEQDEDGYYIAVEKDDDDDDEPEEKPTPRRKKTAAKKTTKKASTRKKAPSRRKKEEPEEPTEPDEKPDVDDKPRGRPKGKPVIYYGCIPQDVPVIDIRTIFETVTPALAKRMKKASYWDCDTWDRRAAFRESGEKIADRYRNKHITCNTSDPDLIALMEAVAPFANVVRGVLL